MITEENLEKAYSEVRNVIYKHTNHIADVVQMQWSLQVRLLAELCEHGNKEEAKKLTDALYLALVEVCFESGRNGIVDKDFLGRNKYHLQ